MTTVIFGKDGQVGRALQKLDWDSSTIFLDRQACDLSDTKTFENILEQHQPSIIINASAYTAVDKAQTEAELAFAINQQAPKIMAEYVAKQAGRILVHYSTDYVFGDTKPAPHLYEETDATGPVERLGIYAQSKLAGEVAIQKALAQANHRHYYILRTSWVYGEGANFIKTMLRLASERDVLKVVDDQWGVPSPASWLANLAKLFIENVPESGIYHAVPDGQTNWHQLAVLAIQTAGDLGYPVRVTNQSITAIPAEQYPLPAPRPYNSGLSNEKLRRVLAQLPKPQSIPHWQEEVIRYVGHLVSSLKHHT